MNIYNTWIVIRQRTCCVGVGVERGSCGVEMTGGGGEVVRETLQQLSARFLTFSLSVL